VCLAGLADTVCPRPSVTLTFDLLTLKMVSESHLRRGTFILNTCGTLGLWVLELFAMYATDEQTDRRTDKSNAYCPIPYGRGIIIPQTIIDNATDEWHKKNERLNWREVVEPIQLICTGRKNPWTHSHRGLLVQSESEVRVSVSFRFFFWGVISEGDISTGSSREILLHYPSSLNDIFPF